MEPRTSLALALKPSGNEQGGHYFVSLHTGKTVLRNPEKDDCNIKNQESISVTNNTHVEHNEPLAVGEHTEENLTWIKTNTTDHKTNTTDHKTNTTDQKTGVTENYQDHITNNTTQVTGVTENDKTKFTRVAGHDNLTTDIPEEQETRE